MILGAAFSANAQTVTFNAPFLPVSQTSVSYGQGIVADANSNLYITGTVNLLFLQRNPNGTYTPESTKIDSVGGTAYGLAIDAANNLYRPDIAPGSNPYLAKYTYDSVNTFTKVPIGTWTIANSPSSVTVDSNYNVYVLDAGGSSVTTGSLFELTPASSCSSNLPACTTYTRTTLLTDTRLHSTTGLSRDEAGNFYLTSGSITGDTPTKLSNSTEAVYKLIPGGGTYSINPLSSGWSSPAATAIDALGNVWVADYGAQKIYQLVPQSSSPAEINFTKIEFQSATSFICLRTLTISKTGQLFGLESGGSGCNSEAIPEVGGTAPHNLGTPALGAPSTQEVDVSFSTPQVSVNDSVVTQGSTTGGFSDATPSSGATSGGIPYCTGGTSGGDTCAIIANFNPAVPGLQTGALLIKNSSGVVIGTNYLYGVGYGSEATLTPGGISTYATASLTSPAAEVVDVKANLYVADPVSNVVLLIAPGGSVSTLAGTGSPSNSSDPGCGGGGLAATTNVTPTGVAIDGAGVLYFSDLNENRVCAVNPSTGLLSIVAGTGAGCSSPTATCGDGGAATSAQLALGSFSGLAVDELGNLLIADSNDNRIRSVNLNTGLITTAAGTGTACATSTATCGDGGQATASGASLNYPAAIAVDAAGDYLIADMNDNRIRKISQLTSVMSTVAGNGSAGSSGNGAPATAAELDAPTGVAVDAAADIYIADQGNSLIRMVTASDGDIMTVAGGGASATSATPIPATNASFQHAAGIAVDGQGNLYVADTGDGYISEVISSAAKLTFPTLTTVNTTDTTDGPLPASLINIGNVALAHGSPPFSSPADFLQATGNATDCTSTFSLVAGLSCTVRVQFAPQSIGSLNESFVIADNSLNGNPSTQTITLVGTGASSAPTISLSPPSETLPAVPLGALYSLSLVASGGTSPYTFAITGGSFPAGLTLSSGGVLSGTPASAVGAFSFIVTATDSSSGGPFTGHASYILTINQGTATVSLSNLAQTYTGSPLPVTAMTSPAGLMVGFTYNGGATAPTAVGSYAVVATVNDVNYQGTTTGTLVISKATATLSLANLAQTYTNSPLPATATTGPAGLTVGFTYNGSATAPTAAGSYAVVATINDLNYQGSMNGILVISKAVATATLGNLAQTYTGSPLAATATTSPTGLMVGLTYNGNAAVPTAAGSYAVVATINDFNYQGSMNGILVISKAVAAATLGSLSQTYTGSPLAATATTSPIGLVVNFTYTGNAMVPTAVGSYAVVATINDVDYQGATTGILVISKAAATISLGNLAQAYTGSALSATATTSPVGLAMSFTYNGNATPPTAAGSYTVVATVNDADYQGATTGILVISKAAATISLGNLAQAYTGSALSATATTSPVGLAMSFTYNGNATPPTAAGNYTVVATVNDVDYQGATTGILVISKAAATISLGNLAQAYTGSALSASASTNPTGLMVIFTYSGNATLPTAAGSYAVVATINNANYQGTMTGTLVVSKATATISLGNLAQAYTGSLLAATATTSPAGLTVIFTYSGAPAAAGSYAVVATISDINYQGTTTGTMVISQQKGLVQWATPAPITYGTALAAAQLDATSSAAGSFTYNPSAGTVLGGGANQTLLVTFRPSDAMNSSSTQTVRITVNQAVAAASISSNDNPSLSQTAVTFNVTVSSTLGTPSGSVTFLDGATPLGAGTLSGGAATLNVSSLARGAHSITAVYNGDANFHSITSGTLAQNVIDFDVTAGTGSGTNGGGGGSGTSGQPTETVAPGGTAAYTISIAPTAGSTFPMATMLTVNGLPAGATATVATAGWTPVTSTSWSLPARASLQDVSLSLHAPGASANLTAAKQPGNSNRIALLTLGLLLLPFAHRLRRVGKQLSREAALLIVLAMVAGSSIGFSGCGARNGFFAQQPQTYNVTVTITTGALSHSTYLTLTVE